jgi:hypothetical protein
LGNTVQFLGGYDITNSNQTGETFFDGTCGFGSGINLSSRSYCAFDHISLVRYYAGVNYDSTGGNNTITTMSDCNCNYIGINCYMRTTETIVTVINANNNSTNGFQASSYANNIFVTTIVNANNNLYNGIFLNGRGIYIGTITNALNNSQSGVHLYSGNCYIDTITNANFNSERGVYLPSDYSEIKVITNANSNTTYGVDFTNGALNKIGSLSTSGNGTAGVGAYTRENYIFNLTCAEGTKVSGIGTNGSNARVYITEYAGSSTDSRIYSDWGNIISQTTTRNTASGVAWQLNPTDTKRNVGYPLKLSVAKVACSANNQVTIQAYLKVSSTTNIAGALVVRGGQLAGMTVADYIQPTSTANTNFNQVTISFTPTEAGVVEVECWAWWVASTANQSVYIDDMTITQA